MPFGKPDDSSFEADLLASTSCCRLMLKRCCCCSGHFDARRLFRR